MDHDRGGTGDSGRAWRISPPMVLGLGFLGLIALSSVLLKIPFATTDALSWSEALFTATSAVTVTGLVVTETGPTFSFWGELVILLLMQVGGLGLMTFAVLALLALGGSITGRSEMVATGGHAETIPADVLRTGRAVVRIALVVEVIAIVPLALVWVPEHGFFQGLWWPVFHAVSAFNNAGFTLAPDSLMGHAGNPVINITITALYLVGGVGFVVLAGLWNARRTRRLDINVKVVLLATLVLSVGGTATILALEAGNPATLGGLPDGGDRFWAAWLQATTPRTAGFNSLDIGALTQPTALVLMLLMFIGAGPNSTGSGIKVTTLVVLAAATWCYIRGRCRPTVLQHPISGVVLLQALAVSFMALLGIFLGTLALSITEQADLLAVAFESVSAIGTVGLSRGLTADLSGWGQVVVMMMMFLGRLCPLTVAYLVGSGFTGAPRRQGELLYIS